ncbi:hypothetical protein LX86_009394 [Lentzea aerocolonigenes]|nr:hypothetical protein [Lentzea aerocolonigenes]
MLARPFEAREFSTGRSHGRAGARIGKIARMSSVRDLEELVAAHSGDFGRAARELRERVRRHTELNGADHPETLGLRLDLARVLGTASQFTKAVHVCEPLLRDQLRVLGPEHDETLETRQLLANLRYRAGDADGARAELEQLLAALSHVLMPTHDRITKLKREIAFLERSS